MLEVLKIIVIGAISLVAGAFVFWRRMEDEMAEEMLWTVIFRLVLWGVAGGRLAWWIWQVFRSGWGVHWLWLAGDYPGMDVWGAVAGGAVVLEREKRIVKSVASEIGDAWIEAVGWTGAVFLLSYWGINYGWNYGKEMLVIVLGMAVWYGIKARYRRFSWYPSGKVGFLWWMGILLLSVIQLVFLAFVPNETTVWRIGYLIVPLTISIIGVYKLSGRDKYADLKNVSKRVSSSLLKLKKRFVR